MASTPKPLPTCDDKRKNPPQKVYALDRVEPQQECKQCKAIDKPKMLDLPPYEPCWTCRYEHKPAPMKLLEPRRCTLYSPKRMRRLVKIIPKFDHCQTLYTKCDFELEKCTQEQINNIENEFKSFEKFLKEQIELQLEHVNEMWESSQRYMMLKLSACCIKPYPEVACADAEKRAMCAFFKNLRLNNESNCHIGFLLERMKESITELNRRCALLDHTVCSPFIRGNAFIRPLKYYRKLIDDLYEYHYGVLCRLKAWLELITLTDSGSIEDYEVILKITAGHKGILFSDLQNCRCRRSKRSDCIRRHIPCWCNLSTACRQWHLVFDGNDPDYQDPKSDKDDSEEKKPKERK